MRKILFCLSIIISCAKVFSAESSDSIRDYSGVKGFVNRIIDYFNDANEPHPERALDISFIGGPHYSSEAGLGIGIVGSGIYYSKRDAFRRPDASTPPSIVSLKVDVTTGQLYKLSGNGYHVFPGDRFRMNYAGYVYSFKDKTWGIGYRNGLDEANESMYKRFDANVKVDFVYCFSDRFFIGPLADFSYVNARRVANPALFDHQRLRNVNVGAGATLLYDSRDVPVNAYKGVYLRINQLFYPGFARNKYSFSESELFLAGYAQVWKGGVLAALYHADLTFGNTPWNLMPTFGDSERMRGYFEGRFRDKCEMDVTVELRQHVWRRNGFAVWLGAGTVFPRFSSFKWNHILPNFGVGYRWQFKPRVNVRLDVGFGKGEKGVNFSINEAF